MTAEPPDDALPEQPASPPPAPAPPTLSFSSSSGRAGMVAAVAGAALAMVDGGVFNIALASVGRSLQTSFAQLQWLLCAHLVPFAALSLFGGALGERHGRRRIFTLGLVLSLIGAGVAGGSPDPRLLLPGRALQGLGAALVLPTSFSLIRNSFAGFDRARATAAWSGFLALAVLVAPLGAGALTQQSWRWPFLALLPITVLALACSRFLPESRAHAGPKLDYLGALTGLLGLTGLTYAVIEGPVRGWEIPPVLLAGSIGLASTALFIRLQLSRAQAMVPLRLLSSAIFTGASLVNGLLHFALVGVTFLLALQLQLRLDYTPLQTATSLLPVGALALILSPAAGRWLKTAGHRLLVSSGALLCGLGFLLLRRTLPGAGYPQVILPALVLLGIGLALTLGPLGSAILKSAGGVMGGIGPNQRTTPPANVDGAAAGASFNGALAQLAGLMAVALLPWLGGRGTAAESFGQAMKICAALAATGAVCAWLSLGALDRRRKTAPPRHSRRAWIGSSQALRR